MRQPLVFGVVLALVFSTAVTRDLLSEREQREERADLANRVSVLSRQVRVLERELARSERQRVELSQALDRSDVRRAFLAEVERACREAEKKPQAPIAELVSYVPTWSPVATKQDLIAQVEDCAAEVRASRPLVAYTTDLANDRIPVTARAGQGFTNVLRVVLPVEPGDLLDVTAYFRVTNDNWGNVGVGTHLWALDADGSRSDWWRIGPSNGDNVDRRRHHMPLHLQTTYRVPDDWPEGHRIAVVVRADAHSTAVRGSIAVDHGSLIVRRVR